MNPGFLSYIFLALSSIVILFGWKTLAIGNCSIRAALLFCFSWVTGALLHWEWGGRCAGTLVYAALLGMSVLLIRSAIPRAEAVSGISYALLLGAVVSLVKLMEAIDPLVIVLDPFFDPLLVLAVLIAAYTRNAALQLFLVTVSLTVADVYMALLYAEWVTPFFGSRVFQDAWWFSAVTMRMLSIILDAAPKAVQRVMPRFLGLLRLRK